MKIRKDGSLWAYSVYDKDVVNVPSSHSRYFVLGPQKLLFQHFPKQIGVWWPHMRSHGSAVDL